MSLPTGLTRLPRLDCAISREAASDALLALGSERIAACMEHGIDVSDTFTVDLAVLDKAMAARGLSISERMNLKTTLRAMGLIKGPRTLLSNAGPFARLA